MALYVEEGSEREQCHLLSSQQAFSQFLCYSQVNWAILALIPGWVCLCTFQDPVGLSNELSCEAGSFSCCLNPHRCFQSEISGFISPSWSPGLCSLSCSLVVPPGLSSCECRTVQSASHHQPLPCPPWSSSHHLLGSLLILDPPVSRTMRTVVSATQTM